MNTKELGITGKKRWANQFLASAHKVFEMQNSKKEKQLQKELDKAYKKIRQLKIS